MGERILVLGNVNVDLVMGEVDGWPAVGTEVILPRSEMRPGGSAGNTALALSGLGVSHRLIAGVGNDAFGKFLVGGFDPACSTWAEMDCATTVTVGIVHKGGDRAFFTTTGHLHHSRLDDLLERLPPTPERGHAIISGGFLIPQLEAGTGHLLQALKQAGWATAVDPGWPPLGWTPGTRQLFAGWLAQADHVLINAEEVRSWSGEDELEKAIEVAASLMAESQVLAVKRGAQGVVARQAGRTLHAAAPEVEVIDTVGAGDTFNAAYLAALADGADVQEALEAGVASASAAISTYPRRYSF